MEFIFRSLRPSRELSGEGVVASARDAGEAAENLCCLNGRDIVEKGIVPPAARVPRRGVGAWALPFALASQGEGQRGKPSIA